jgi:16S rRNA processing protein RimM
MILLKLEGVDDRDAAERLRGKNVYMSEEELPELPENEHYIRDMIGMEVYDEPSGRIVGTLKDVLTERAQPVYVVNTEDGGEVLIPGVPVFVKKIDETTRRITVALIEGMLP